MTRWRCDAPDLQFSAHAALLAACGSSTSSVPSIIAGEGDFEFGVSAEGELVSAESMPIAIPGSIRMAFNIAWMAPEFSDVKEGDVIARFDDVQIRIDRETTALDVAKSEFQLANTERTGEVELTRLGHESLRVEGEREISEAFASVDERLLSRNELIDALADVDYLDTESEFLDWQSQTFDQRIQAERNMIMAEKQGDLTKLQKQDTALQMMELRSPADGTFVYARTPWGQKLGKGKTVFPGMPVGLLPLRGKVKARLFVPELDAVGLEAGQRVRFTLDSAPGQEFAAQVESVSPVASPRNRTDPRKFFSVEATIDDIDAELMRVGSRIRGNIITGDVSDGLVLPAQAVYGDASDAHVYVVSGGRPERREVRIGQRSPDLVEITEGISSGDRISLVAPPGQG